jgi:hypothetical protein
MFSIVPEGPRPYIGHCTESNRARLDLCEIRRRPVVAGVMRCPTQLCALNRRTCAGARLGSTFERGKCDPKVGLQASLWCCRVDLGPDSKTPLQCAYPKGRYRETSPTRETKTQGGRTRLLHSVSLPWVCSARCSCPPLALSAVQTSESWKDYPIPDDLGSVLTVADA